MEGALLSSPSEGRFRTHLKNAANAICARTLPKQRRPEPLALGVAAARHHHTYPRAAPPGARRAPIPARLERPPESAHPPSPPPPPPPTDCLDMCHTRGSLPREAAKVWRGRVGTPTQPAPPDRVQSLFNDIELYPTKTQVFEMLMCARQCARRKSLSLTFGEFCVFAAELRLHIRRARQTSNKPESPQWSAEKEQRERETRTLNGSEASSPPAPCEVFLGGSCNPTTWRSDIAIPMLDQMGITYFNPQVADWSLELMEVEHRAKAAARALLFVLDNETRAVAASVEVAHLSAAPRDLLLVLRPYRRHQHIGREPLSDQEYVELSRARATLQEAVERRGLPAFTDIPSALRCARAVLRGARTHPRHQLGHTILRLKRAFDAAGGRAPRLPRARALRALQEVTAAPRHVAERSLPAAADSVDFEAFCAAVVELASDRGDEAVSGASGGGAGAGRASGVAARVRRVFRALRDRLAHAYSPAPGPQRASPPDSPMRNDYGTSENTTVYRSSAGGVGAGAGEQCGGAAGGGGAPANGLRADNGLHAYNARLRAYGKKLKLIIPKNGGSRENSSGEIAPESGEALGAVAGGAAGAEGVFTPGTERRLERLPAMLGAPTHDVYLGGCFPSNCTRPEEILRREGFSYVIPRANDYTRMFSAPARRSAPAHPESPRTDKKPRGAPASPPPDDDVELRQRSEPDQPADRLSASDFYTVTEDHTPQPFKGTYDEDLLLGSRVLLFSLSAEAPCFSAMVLAAHHMGLRPRATLLLVQPMDMNAPHGYSEAAVKDYNRGRHYLTDLARRSKVPVFDSTEEAVACALRRLRDPSH